MSSRREAEDLGDRQDVLRVLVVAAQAHEDADVVEQRRHLEQQAVAVAEAVLGAQLVEEAHGEERHVPRVRARRSGTSRRAPRRWPAPGAQKSSIPCPSSARAMSRSSPARSDASGTRTLLGLRLEQQLAVDEERGHQRLGLGQGQAVALDELLVVERHRSASQKARNALAREAADAARGRSSPAICSAAKRTSPPRARKCRASRSGISRRMSSTMLWTVPAEQAHALLVAAVPGGEVLAHADRPERVGARSGRARPCAGTRGRRCRRPPRRAARRRAASASWSRERLAHRQVGEAVLLGAVDDLDVDARCAGARGRGRCRG